MPIAELGDSLRLCRRIAWHVFSESNGINSFRVHRHPRGTANVQHSLIDPVLPDEKLDVDFVFFGESRADRQGTWASIAFPSFAVRASSNTSLSLSATGT